MSGSPPRGRVLHALSEFGAPSETFLTDRMIELERLGWESWVGTGELVAEPSAIEFPAMTRVVLGRSRDRWRERLLRSKRRGELHSWWLDHAIERARPDLIHAHFGWTGLAALGACRRHRLPLVVGFHGYDATVYPRYGFGALDQPGAELAPGIYASLFESADRILAVSEFVAMRLRELGCDREVEVIPSGIRLERFAFRGPRPASEELRVAFIGRLVPYKGLEVLLRALALLDAGVPRVHLDVIGDGPTRAADQALATELGVDARFHGAREHAFVASTLTRADVLAFPSRTTEAGQSEGLGNVVKEAFAVGLQIVATASGGIPETFPPELRGELVAENDERALARALTALWLRRDQWRTRAVRGREWVEEAFDWRVLAPRIAAVYEHVAERRGQRG